MRGMLKFQLAVKRILDLILALLGLLFIWPLLLFIALLLRLDSPGAVFFRQIRVGLGGSQFRMLKFRSMYANADEIRNPDGSTFVGRTDPRITRLGRYLREFGIDELPQLIHVFKGEMSLVGPRPIQPDQHDDLPEDMRFIYSSMRPGITSLAQVRGRNELAWEKRQELEVYYVKNYSLWLDLRILAMTLPTVLLRKGVYNPHA